jgi:hypothetical protein
MNEVKNSLETGDNVWGLEFIVKTRAEKLEEIFQKIQQ